MNYETYKEPKGKSNLDFHGNPKQLDCEYNENGHNMTWINHNRTVAEDFVAENCEMRQLEKQANPNYIHGKDEIIKLEPGLAHITFALISPKGNKAYPLPYEENPFEFKIRLKETLEKLQAKKNEVVFSA